MSLILSDGNRCPALDKACHRCHILCCSEAEGAAGVLHQEIGNIGDV